MVIGALTGVLSRYEHIVSLIITLHVGFPETPILKEYTLEYRRNPTII